MRGIPSNRSLTRADGLADSMAPCPVAVALRLPPGLGESWICQFRNTGGQGRPDPRCAYAPPPLITSCTSSTVVLGTIVVLLEPFSVLHTAFEHWYGETTLIATAPAFQGLAEILDLPVVERAVGSGRPACRRPHRQRRRRRLWGGTRGTRCLNRAVYGALSPTVMRLALEYQRFAVPALDAAPHQPF